MNRIFGQKKPKGPTPTLGETAIKMDARTKLLDDKIRGLDDELRKYQTQIKKTKGPTQANLKRRALEVLKRKKMFEQQRDQLAAQSFNVDQTNFTMDSIKDTMSTVDAMKGAHKTMQAQVKKIKIDEVEDVTDDLADMMEDMNEINDALGRNYGVSDGIDETDLDAELAALEDDLENLDGEEVAAGAADEAPAYLQSAAMPAEPTHMPEEKRQNQVDEFGLPVAPMRG